MTSNIFLDQSQLISLISNHKTILLISFLTFSSSNIPLFIYLLKLSLFSHFNIFVTNVVTGLTIESFSCENESTEDICQLTILSISLLKFLSSSGFISVHQTETISKKVFLSNQLIRKLFSNSFLSTSTFHDQSETHVYKTIHQFNDLISTFAQTIVHA
jgi:hypothetical protein